VVVVHVTPTNVDTTSVIVTSLRREAHWPNYRQFVMVNYTSLSIPSHVLTILTLSRNMSMFSVRYPVRVQELHLTSLLTIIRELLSRRNDSHTTVNSDSGIVPERLWITRTAQDLRPTCTPGVTRILVSARCVESPAKPAHNPSMSRAFGSVSTSRHDRIDRAFQIEPLRGAMDSYCRRLWSVRFSFRKTTLTSG